MPHLLAIDANPYAVRLATVDYDGYLHGGIDVKPTHTDKILMFIRSQAFKSVYRMPVVGSPLDRWPSDLHRIVEQELGTDIDWISPDFLRNTAFEVTYWQQRRKFDRARLLALAAASLTGQLCDPDGIVRQWQRALIDEMLQRLDDTTPKS